MTALMSGVDAPPDKGRAMRMTGKNPDLLEMSDHNLDLLAATQVMDWKQRGESRSGNRFFETSDGEDDIGAVGCKTNGVSYWSPTERADHCMQVIENLSEQERETLSHIVLFLEGAESHSPFKACLVGLFAKRRHIVMAAIMTARQRKKS